MLNLVILCVYSAKLKKTPMLNYVNRVNWLLGG